TIVKKEEHFVELPPEVCVLKVIRFSREIGSKVFADTGDDKGLVLTPKVLKVQVIVIYVPFKDADVKEIMNACSKTVKTLDGLGIRVEAYLKENYSPGRKYAHYELMRLPLRIGIGPKDLANI
nr:aminoacyl-tRNA synthetase, class II [Tanacetum cinerariifolium]